MELLNKQERENNCVSDMYSNNTYGGGCSPHTTGASLRFITFLTGRLYGDDACKSSSNSHWTRNT